METVDGRTVLAEFIWYGEPVCVVVSSYETDRNKVAIVAVVVHGEQFGVLSVNVDQPLDKDEFVVSHNVSPEIMAKLLESTNFADTGKRMSYGFVVNQPVYRIVR